MTTSGSSLEFYMLDLINAERAANGKDPLKLEQNLNQSAEDHSKWMIGEDVFSHTGIDGSSATDRITDAGFQLSGSWRTGENIGYQSERGVAGFFDDVEDIHGRLMASSGHRWNILNSDYDYVGIGIEYGNYNGYNVIMITQNFATTSAPVILDGPGSTPDPTMIVGTSGKDQIVGTSGDDDISGQNGNDVINGGSGDDTIRGDNGSDWITGGDGADELRGGKGVDVVDYHGLNGSVTADLQYENTNAGGASGDVYYSIAWLRGTASDDTLRGNDWGNQLRGGSGDDTLNGRGGNDTLYGGSGNDVLRGAEGDDTLYGKKGSDRFVFEANMGRDVVKDFEDDIDKLDFRDLGFESLSAVMARADVQGNDVVFDLAGSDQVIIENASLSEIQDDIFF